MYQIYRMIEGVKDEQSQENATQSQTKLSNTSSNIVSPKV